MSRILRSLGFGIHFGEFSLEKKVLVLVSENMVSEKSYGFGLGEFGRGKKVSSRFRKKSLGIGFGQNFGIVFQ